jgi:succinoglycan biosynthesis transport protein ExoP
MTQPSPAASPAREFAKSLTGHPWLWIVPTAVVTLLATAYALTAPPTWKASQALLVRDEAAGGLGRQGRFDSTDAMKSAQETILEMARNGAVAEAALREAGPPPGHRQAEAWPMPDDVRGLQDAIKITAPKGAEFGRTEVIHLAVTAGSRPRAIDLTRAVSKILEIHLKDLRNRKARSIAAELQKQVHLAQGEQDAATRRLQAMESEVGGDLGELRMLNDSGRGDSNLRNGLNRIQEEVRQARSARHAKKQQLHLLIAAREDPNPLIATPNDLLESQPALRRLKEGLVDAQLRTAQILGKMSKDHPLARAAAAGEQEVRQKLYKELELATLGLEADLKVSDERIKDLEGQAADVQGRLDRLARLRAQYSNLANEARQRSEVLEKAQKALADARASESAAQASSLLTRLEDPQADIAPLGPGRATIVLGGLLGGLAAGIGLVFLVYPPANAQGRRWTDRLKFGRRATDPPTARRAEDPSTARRAEDQKPARRAGDATRQPASEPAPEEQPVLCGAEGAAPVAERRSGQDRRQGG